MFLKLYCNVYRQIMKAEFDNQQYSTFDFPTVTLKVVSILYNTIFYRYHFFDFINRIQTLL